MTKLDAPFKMTAMVTRRCNLRCRHCYSRCADIAEGAEELSTEEWQAVFDQAAQDGVIFSFVEGGEPLLRPDIFDLLGFAAERMQVWLRSNATLIDGVVARELKRRFIDTVVVDLLSPSPQQHDALTGVVGSFDAALAGVRHLRTAGIEVIVATFLTRYNHRDLRAFGELLAGLDVPKLGILRLHPIGYAKDNWADLALSLDEMARALTEVASLEQITVMHSWHPNDDNCCWQNAAVTADGRSVGCPYLREFVDYGNVRAMSLLETWRHPLHARLRSGLATDGKPLGSCPSCSSTQQTQGGCRASAYAFHRDWDAPDPFCSTLNQGVDLRVLPDDPAAQG
jgi:radical SAM protein with 4Fe4S-binding SPASM domain